MKYFIRGITRHYFNFKGRATRAEFIQFISVILGVEVCLFAFAFIGFVQAAQVLSVVFEVFIIIPFLSVMVRRLHDCDFSGWWLFIPLLLAFIAYCILAYAMSEYPNLTDADIKEFFMGGKQDILSDNQRLSIKILTTVAGVILIFVGVIALFLPSKHKALRFGRLGR